MAPRTRANPLALAVLACLLEKPMHPYEMAQTMRARAKHDSVKLNYGSLYGVVEGLEGRGLIRAVETTREGRRPPRTVYDITDDGAREMNEWLSELVAIPVKEYLQFEAALSFLPGLPPDEALSLLRQRCSAIEVQLDQLEAVREGSEKRGLPRLFELEVEYKIALARAELDFTRLLVTDLESGDITGLDEWRSWYQPATPADGDGDGDGDGEPPLSAQPDHTGDD